MPTSAYAHLPANQRARFHGVSMVSDQVSVYSGWSGFIQLTLQLHQLLAISRSVAVPVAALGGFRLRGRREFRIS